MGGPFLCRCVLSSSAEVLGPGEQEKSGCSRCFSLCIHNRREHTDPAALIRIGPTEILALADTAIWCRPATLLVKLIAKDWKQSKGPSIQRPLSKLWYIQSMEYLFYVFKALTNEVDFREWTCNGVHDVLGENRELHYNMWSVILLLERSVKPFLPLLSICKHVYITYM